MSRAGTESTTKGVAEVQGRAKLGSVVGVQGDRGRGEVLVGERDRRGRKEEERRGRKVQLEGETFGGFGRL
jgi:hypothetical protein